jgi:hypothetical protein
VHRRRRRQREEEKDGWALRGSGRACGDDGRRWEEELGGEDGRRRRTGRPPVGANLLDVVLWLVGSRTDA